MRGLRNFSDEQWRRNAVQPVLPNPSASNFPAPSAAWSDVARACRRICVLRERGQAEEAERLRTGELAELVASLHRPGETEASVAERVASIFAVEEERVANAAVLAELLAPLLNSQARPEPVVQAAPAPLPVAVERFAAPAPPSPPAPRAGGGSIADFIDEMIAQENGPGRKAPARRAS